IGPSTATDAAMTPDAALATDAAIMSDAAVEAGAVSPTGDAAQDARGSDAVANVDGGCGPGKRGFGSSSAGVGNFGASAGGAAGADTVCQQVADARALGGTWRAWVTDQFSWPAKRFSSSQAVTYVLAAGGDLVACGRTGLATTLMHAIDRTEDGGAPPQN